MDKCPNCNKTVDISHKNSFRPFCSERCKLIDFGSWAGEENIVSRPIESEDFYEE